MPDLNHLHLHVRDLERSRAFYERWFGFRERVRHGDILFLRNADGFDLALVPDERTPAFPAWFHFGFRLDAPESVHALHEAMDDSAGALPRSLHAEVGYVTFRCADPDGYAIEVYWEA